MQKLSDLKKIIDRLIDVYPDMELDVVYRYISVEEQKLKQRIHDLECLLQELHPYFDNLADTVDGPFGPEANQELTLMTMIENALEAK